MESGNWGKHAKGIRREKEDVLWVPSDARKDCIINEVQWIGGTRVFRDRIIVIVGDFAFFVENHVLKNLPTPNCLPDVFRSPFLIVNALCLSVPFAITTSPVTP